MNLIITILIVSVFVGLASAAWLMVIIMIASKKVKNKKVLERWLRIHIAMAAIALIAGCSPGKMLNTAYLVSIDTKEPRDFKWQRFSTADSADAYIFKITQLELSTHRLISTDPPFYDVRNGRHYIYVEKQSLYQRPGGKTHWKVYDEKLDY